MFMKKRVNRIYKIKTKTGKVIKVSGEHPLYTLEGMKEAEKISKEDKLISYSFEGVKYEEPSNDTIIDFSDIIRILDKVGITNKGNARTQILNHIKKLNILPLKYNSKELPILIKLMGFIFGDGVLTFLKDNKGFTHFYGKEEDLILISKDLIKLGFTSPKIFKRDRHHSINTGYGVIEFEYKENAIIKKNSSIAVLFAALGVPAGRKTAQVYRVPEWLMKAPLWQKRLFLASFFGAELSKPKTMNKYNFYMPQINMNKSEKLIKNGIDLLNDLRLILYEFGVESNYPVFVKGNNYEGKNGKTIGLRFLINGRPENLIKLYSKIGYEYNIKKQKLACLAINYLKLKELEINQIIISKNSNQLIKHRIRPDFISFKDYIDKYSFGDYGLTVEEVEEIKTLNYNGSVYDFTVNDPNHNFIANNFVISNCGMRLVTTNLTFKEVQPKLKELVDTLFKIVPAGVGAKGFVQVNKQQFKEVMEQGSKWCVENDYGWKEDLERTEGYGKIDWADSSKVSDKAISRGINQMGTLGSGNHYLEIQKVEKQNIVDEKLAKKLGIFPDQIVIMVHCGSRGFGHQIATDYLQKFDEVMKKYNIIIRDRELSCAPFNSKEGQDYYKGMACAANMAFANRQVILHRIREGFSKVFKKTPEELEMNLVYDVAHNVAKLEEHKVDGKKKKLIVHRKGSTRAFPPKHEELNKLYKDIGQPVIIGGSMETGSYLLVGTKKAMDETFGTTCHGSGRTMSRTQARHEVRGDKLQKDMENKGIYVRTVSMSGLAEEAGVAYKDINEVVKTVELAGISKPVVGLKPIGNVKG